MSGWQGPIDFLLPTDMIAVEVDEPYWHAKVIDRDAKKTLFLQTRGYTVVRLIATPFYGDFAEPMVDAVRAGLDMAEHTVTVSDVASLYPLQLALPLDQEWVITGRADA